jgi:putative transposase
LAPVPQWDRDKPSAMSQAERQAILDVLHSDRFIDLEPAEVWATLLDEAVYVGSISTFHRLLRRAGQTRERRRQATRPVTVKPELACYTRIRLVHGTSPSCVVPRTERHTAGT